MRSGWRSPQDLALIAVFAALIAALSLVSVNVLGAVPITLQTLALSVTAMVLGPWRACGAVTMYLLVGLAGLPVFAGGVGGPTALVRPSAGYLLAFPLFALLVGWLSRQVLHRGWRSPTMLLFVAAVVSNLVVIYPLGIVGMMLVLRLSWRAAWIINLGFIPLDVVKTLLAAIIAWAVLRAFPWLALPPVTTANPVTTSSPVTTAGSGDGQLS